MDATLLSAQHPPLATSSARSFYSLSMQLIADSSCPLLPPKFLSAHASQYPRRSNAPLLDAAQSADATLHHAD